MGKWTDEVRAKNVQREQPRVVVLVPSYASGPRVARLAQMAMMNTARAAGVKVAYIEGGTSAVHWSRNCLIRDALTSVPDFEYALMIDADMVPQPDTLLKLLSHRKDIVSAICTTRVLPLRLCVFKRLESGKYKALESWEPTERLVRVDAVGTGCLLLSRKVIDRMTEFYNDLEWDRQVLGVHFGHCLDGLKTEDRDAVLEKARLHFDVVAEHRKQVFAQTKTAYWFQFLPYPEAFSHEYSEDLAFCRKAEMAQIPVYVDSEVEVGHVGECPFGVKQFTQQQPLAKAGAQGA